MFIVTTLIPATAATREAWDDDFSISIATDAPLSVPAEIKNSQQAVRGHLRNIKHFAAEVEHLKKLIASLSYKDEVEQTVVDEADAIIALAETGDQEDEEADLEWIAADDEVQQHADSRRRSLVGRSILEDISTHTERNTSSEPESIIEVDIDKDDAWDSSSDDDDDDNGGVIPQIQDSRDTEEKRRLDFSAEALPGLIERTEKVIAQLSSVLG